MTASVDCDRHGGSYSHSGLARVKSVSKVSQPLVLAKGDRPKSLADYCNDCDLQVRKPYTITKQRERWTENEHEMFLEALKLYGRAWRSIQGKSLQYSLDIEALIALLPA